MEVMVGLPNPSFWEGRRVLLTGHTGFKGSWLARWLNRLGAQVTGIALSPVQIPSLFDVAGIAQCVDSQLCDVRELKDLSRRVRAAAPEIVLHLAALPLVRQSYREPIETFSTNVMGTANLLESVRGLASTKVVVVVSTDKVYRDSGEAGVHFCEDEPLGGHDPYSASKAASEIVAASYRSAFLRSQGVAVATARAGNVIGGGDWSEDRLIPDSIRAWNSGRRVAIRMPRAVRPWQHVLEPLAGYLILAEQLFLDPQKAGAYNFGPDKAEIATVSDVVQMAAVAFGGAMVEVSESPNNPQESGWLALNANKARIELGVVPRWSLQTAVERTINWYRRYEHGENACSLCDSDISAFETGS
jgi:CDP-glucose 4,6-dehydratase